MLTSSLGRLFALHVVQHSSISSMALAVNLKVTGRSYAGRGTLSHCARGIIISDALYHSTVDGAVVTFHSRHAIGPGE